MAFNVEELRQTLELNRNDIMHNHSLTNEYMVDDIMRELGYNKRRNKDVKRLTDKPIDWEVLSDGGSRIAVKVFALGDDFVESEVSEAMEYARKRRFSVFIVTNGETLNIYRYNKIKMEYTNVCSVSLMEEIEETKLEILQALSNDNLDLKVIDDFLSKKNISDENVINVIKDNTKTLASHIASLMGDSSQSVIDQCTSILDKLLSEKEIVVSDHEDVNVSEYVDTIDNLNKRIVELEEALENADKSNENENEDESEKVKALKDKVAELMSANAGLEEQVSSLSQTIESLEEAVKAEKTREENANGSTSGSASESNQDEIDAYREQIQEYAVKMAELQSENDTLKNELKSAEDKINDMAGTDKQKAIELLNVIEDNEELPRSYVAVINTELMQYEQLNTFVGRTLQKLYEIKSIEASQFIFNGDVFKLVQPSVRNDLIMNTKTYDIDISDIPEDEVLNKLRIVFSHFNDLVFECKKIGTIKQVEEDNLDDVEIQSEDVVDDTLEVSDDADFESEDFDDSVDETAVEIDEDNSDLEDMQITDSDEQSDEFDDDIQEFDTEPESVMNSTGVHLGKHPEIEEDSSFDEIEDDAVEVEDDAVEVEDNQEENDDFSDYEVENNMFNVDNFGTNTVSDENTMDAALVGATNIFGAEFNAETGELAELPESNIETVDSSNEIRALLCGQLAQIEMLLWNETPVNFLNIKYIGSSNITFDINSASNDIELDALLSKCIDSVIALAVSYGDDNIISKLRTTDLSQLNNNIKLLTSEYAGHTRINGTRYVIVGLTNIQNVATVLFDICNGLGIDMSDIFLYFDATTESQQLVDDWGYEEEAIQLREYTNYTYGNEFDSVAILKGNIFNNIMVTKNSLKAHMNVLGNTVAVKTNYTKRTTRNDEDFFLVIQDIMSEAAKNGVMPNVESVGNVIGEGYRLLSTDESHVAPEHETLSVLGTNVFVSKVAEWQKPLSIIKVHTTLLNNTSIAVKTNVNSQALDFYLNEFEAAEPSLSLAVLSFVRYINNNTKRQ